MGELWEGAAHASLGSLGLSLYQAIVFQPGAQGCCVSASLINLEKL